MKTKLFAALLGLLCLIVPSRAQDAPKAQPAPLTPVERLGDVAFRVPANWTRTVTRDMLVIAAPDVPKGEAMGIALLTNLDYTGTDFAAWCREQTRSLNAKHTVIDDSRPLLTTDPETGVETVLYSLRVKDAQGRTRINMVQAGHDGRRAYFAMAITTDPKLLVKNRADYLRFMSSLYFLEQRPARP